MSDEDKRPIDRWKLLLAVNEAFDHDNPTVKSALNALLVAMQLAEDDEDTEFWRHLDKINSEEADLGFGILYAKIARAHYFECRWLTEIPEEERSDKALTLCLDYIRAVHRKSSDNDNG